MWLKLLQSKLPPKTSPHLHNKLPLRNPILKHRNPLKNQRKLPFRMLKKLLRNPLKIHPSPKLLKAPRKRRSKYINLIHLKLP
jgi:hypothetical protein